MIMLKTNFNKSSGNSKEDTFKSSSTMKVVDQESIRQRNSKPISRETQSNQHKRIQTVSSKCCRTPIEDCNPRKILKWTKKSNVDFMPSNISRKHLTSWRFLWDVVEKKQRRKVYFITGGPNRSRETRLHLYWAQDYLKENVEVEWMGMIVWSYFHIVYVAGELKD